MPILKCPAQLNKLFFLIFSVVTLVVTAYFFQKYSSEIIAWVEQQGWLAPAFFLIIYCLASLMFLPTMVLTLAGGAIFGPVIGTVFNLLGATLGAACSFLITRYLIADRFTRKNGTRLNQLIHEVERKGWISIAFFRLFPMIPFHLVNYGMGLTRVRFRTFCLTTFIFLIPLEIIYTYLGYAGMEAILKNGSFCRNGGIIVSGIILLILVAKRVLKSEPRP